MGIVLEEWKRVLDFVTGPHIPIILSILSFISTLPIFFFIWGNLFFLTIFFEIILWIVGLVLAFAAGFAMTNLKEKEMLYAFWAGIRTMVLLHMPRYVMMGLGMLAFGLNFLDNVGPELFFKNVILQMATLGFWLLIIISFIGGLLGGIGGLVGKGLGRIDRFGTTRPTRKNWKIKN